MLLKFWRKQIFACIYDIHSWWQRFFFVDKDGNDGDRPYPTGDGSEFGSLKESKDGPYPTGDGSEFGSLKDSKDGSHNGSFQDSNSPDRDSSFGEHTYTDERVRRVMGVCGEIPSVINTDCTVSHILVLW